MPDRAPSETKAGDPALAQRLARLEEENAQLRARISALEHTESQLQRVLEGADEGFWDWDLVDNTFTVSERFETMMGFKPGERNFSPERWATYVHPEDLARAKESIRQHLEGRAPSHTLEFRCLNKSGEWMYLLTRGRVVSRDANGKALKMSGTHTDISERKHAEAKLIEAMARAEKASLDKSRFLAAASHDLRQPMQAIRLLVDSLGRTRLGDDQKRLCSYIDESTLAICSLLNTLLDISKLDSGAITPHPEAIQSQALMSRIDAEFSPLAAEKGLRIRLRAPTRNLTLMTDGKLLMSLLGNLIGNAIKYTGKGSVLVALRPRGAGVRVQVWDTGIGIAPQHLDSIFEEYFQVGNPERDRTRGLGLGLAIARRIATLLDTSILCRSRLGQGSLFEFQLPVANPPADTAPGPDPLSPTQPQPRPANARRVVLVEDDLMVGMAVKLALESCGMSVSRYKTAEEALADPELSAASFYIADLRLPGLSGIEFLDTVQRQQTKPIKAVLMTGDTAIKRIEMMRSTHWQVLFKPVDLAQLLAAIEAQDSAHLVFKRIID